MHHSLHQHLQTLGLLEVLVHQKYQSLPVLLAVLETLLVPLLLGPLEVLELPWVQMFLERLLVLESLVVPVLLAVHLVQ